MRKWPDSRLHDRTRAAELQVLGGSPRITETMMGLVSLVGQPWQVWSEWRWACAISDMQDPRRCRRIEPSALFAHDLIFDQGDALLNLILILYKQSITPDRLAKLRAAGFHEETEMSDGVDVVFYVHQSRVGQ